MLKSLVILTLLGLSMGDVDPGPEPSCPSDNSVQAYFATNDCTKYWQCSNGVAYLMPCAPGTHWEQSLWICVHIASSTCTGEGWSSTKAPTTPITTTTTTTTTQAPITKSTTTTPASTTTKASTTPITTTNGALGECPSVDGPDSIYFPDLDCTKFWQCSNGVAYQHKCPAGLHFNPVLNVCDWPDQAGCEGGNSPSTQPTTTSTQSASTTKPTTSTPTTQATSTEEVQTTTNISPGECPLKDGPDSIYFPDPDCTKFWQCSNGVAYQHTCPAGLHFNPILNVCDWPDQAGCEKGNNSTTQPTNTTTESASTTKPPTTQATSTEGVQTTTTNGASGECPPVDGPDSIYFPDSDCTKFWQCSNGVAYQHTCPAGLHFNPVLNVCDWPHQAGCEGGNTPLTQPTTTTTKSASTTKPSTITTQATSTEKAETTTTTGASGECPLVDGPDSIYFPDPDCTKFWQCSNGIAYQHTCPAGLHFNPVLNVCDWPDQAGCKGGNSPSIQPTTTTRQSASTTKLPTTISTTQATSAEEAQTTTTTGEPTYKTTQSISTTKPPTTARTTQATSTEKPQTTTTTRSFTEQVSEQTGKEVTEESSEQPTEASTEPDGQTSTSKHTTEVVSTTEAVTTTTEGMTTTTTTQAPATPECLPPPTICTCTCVPQEPTTTSVWTTSLPSSTTPVTSRPPNLTTTSQTTSEEEVSSSVEDNTTENGEVSTSSNTDVTSEGSEEQNENSTPSSNDNQSSTENNSEELTTSSEQDCDNGPIAPGVCPSEDGDQSVYLPDKDCTKFWQCSNGVAHLMNCSEGLHFNPTLNVCDSPWDAGCDENVTKPIVDFDESSSTPESTMDENTSPSQESTVVITSTKETTNAGTSTTPVDSVSTTEAEFDGPSSCSELSNLCPAVDGEDPTYIALEYCGGFCQCSNRAAYYHPCPPTLHFNPELNVCDYPYRAGCTGIAGTTPTTSKPTSSRESSLRTEGHTPTTEATTTTTTQSPTTTSTTKAATTTTTTTELPTTSQETDNVDYVCLERPNDFFLSAHPKNCSQYLTCDHGKSDVMQCPAGLHFSPTIYVCVSPAMAGCTATVLEQPTGFAANLKQFFKGWF